MWLSDYRGRVPTPTPDDPPRAPSGASGAPVALRLVAVLAVLQGLATLVLGAVEGFALDSDRTLMGATTAFFFLAYGVLLALCGVALWRVVRWARGPVLFAQLVWLPVAWTLRDGALGLAVPLGLSALVCLVCLLRPSAIEAIDGQRYADGS